MHFCNSRRLHPDPTLKMGDTIILIVDKTKFLGLIFDKKLTFSPHLKYLRDKCQKAMNLLKVVSSMDWGADREVLLRLFRALIRSKLDYGSIIYGAARKSYLKKIEPIQNQALRISLGAFRTSPIKSLHVEANEMPMSIRQNKLALQYLLKTQAHPQNPARETIQDTLHLIDYSRKPKAIKPIGLRTKKALKKVCPNLKQIALCTIPKTPPWELHSPEINLSLATGKKEETNTLVYQLKYRELKHQYTNYHAIYTDGSKDERKVGAAAVTDTCTAPVRLLDSASIFTTELKAIISAVEMIAISPRRKKKLNNIFRLIV